MASSTITNLRDLPIASHTLPKPELGFDPIYFTKSSVKLGTRIKYYGRINPGSVWVVQTIWTFRNEKYGRVRSWIADVRTIHDVLEIRNDRTGEIRNVSFEYVSSSARWRIEAGHE